LSETLRRLLSVGDKFPTVSFGGARMTSAVGFCRVNQGIRAWCLKRMNVAAEKKWGGKRCTPLVPRGRVSDVGWRLSEESKI
jgi:hypothetical protein